jgi:tetratricopeptide (TPR) repeat protein
MKFLAAQKSPPDSEGMARRGEGGYFRFRRPFRLLAQLTEVRLEVRLMGGLGKGAGSGRGTAAHMNVRRNYRFETGRLTFLLICVVALVACSHDPNVLKQKYLESGNRYFNQGQYRSAAIQYLNAIRMDSKFEEAHFRLAQSYLKLGMAAGAYQELTRAVEDNPDDLKAQVALGNLLLASREFHHAQDVAETVLQKDPNNVEGRILLANSYAALNNIQASLDEMQGAIRLAPSQPQSYLNMAYLQLDAKQTAQAEESFKKTVELAPKSALAALALGNFYMEQRRWPEAQQQFQRAADLEPKNPLPRVALARLYLAQGRKEQAEQVLQQAKTAMPDNPVAYRMLGDFYFATGDLGKAVAEYASMCQQHPKDLVAQENYVRLLILHRDLSEATELNDKLLKQNPKDTDLQVLRGQILSAQGRPDDAIEVLQNATKAEPDHALAHYALGVAFNQKGDLARAEAEWREAARLQPGLVDAQRALVNLAMRKHDMDLLAQASDALIAALPNSPGGYIDRATARIEKGDTNNGEADLQRAAQLAPQNPLPYSRLAALRVMQKRYAEAEKLYEQSLDRDPNFVEALNGLVALDMDQKEPEKAEARVKAQIAKAPANFSYQVTLAKVFASQKKWNEAQLAASKAVDQSGGNLEAVELLGQVQEILGQYDQAASTYQRAIQAKPNDPSGYVMLAQLKGSRGNWQQAQTLYQQALQVKPDYPPAANNLAYLMLEHGLNADVALSLAQAARRGMPTSAAAADTLGWAYYTKGVYGSAATQLEEAVKMSPQDGSYHYHLGLTYAKLGDKTRARSELDRAVSLNPAYAKAPDVRQALAELAHK